jgi:hypothetical protein
MTTIDAPTPPSAGAPPPPRPRITSNFFPAFSDEELGRRHAMVRAAMRARGVDCLVIHGFHHYNGNDVGQTNIVYLADFANVVQSYVVLPLETEPTLVVGLQFQRGGPGRAYSAPAQAGQPTPAFASSTNDCNERRAMDFPMSCLEVAASTCSQSSPSSLGSAWRCVAALGLDGAALAPRQRWTHYTSDNPDARGAPHRRECLGRVSKCGRELRTALAPSSLSRFRS